MSDIVCDKCGYKTFIEYALKDAKGKLICPQCREPYKKDLKNFKSSFKFKQEGNKNPETK